MENKVYSIEKMFEIIEHLKKNKIINEFVILELIDEDFVKIIKIKVKLIDGSTLFINEKISKTGYRYSYHWQDKNQNVLIRWDNAPHFINISTFPHHKHSGGRIESSYKLDIKEVLDIIKNNIKNK